VKVVSWNVDGLESRLEHALSVVEPTSCSRREG
jgi:hypothetical protein